VVDWWGLSVGWGGVLGGGGFGCIGSSFEELGSAGVCSVSCVVGGWFYVDLAGIFRDFGLVRAWQTGVLYGRPSVRAKKGIQKPVQI